MSYFLRSSIRGLPLDVEENLLDSEYADGSSLYVEDSEETFEAVRVALDTLFLSAGSNKFAGFLIDPTSMSIWGLQWGFT